MYILVTLPNGKMIYLNQHLMVCWWGVKSILSLPKVWGGACNGSRASCLDELPIGVCGCWASCHFVLRGVQTWRNTNCDASEPWKIVWYQLHRSRPLLVSSQPGMFLQMVLVRVRNLRNLSKAVSVASWVIYMETSTNIFRVRCPPPSCRNFFLKSQDGSLG